MKTRNVALAVLCLSVPSLAFAGSLTGFEQGLLRKLLKQQLSYGEVVIPWTSAATRRPS